MSYQTQDNFEKGVEMFAEAIVLQAVLDYRLAAKKLKIKEHEFQAKNDIEKIERFFKSDYFELIANVNGEYILDELKKRIKFVTFLYIM